MKTKLALLSAMHYGRRRRLSLTLALLAAAVCFGGAARAQQYSKAGAADRHGYHPAAVQQYDVVLPQLVDGNGWQTSFVITNLDSQPRNYALDFFADDGSRLMLPLEGAPNGANVVWGQLLPYGTIMLNSVGTATALRQGYALLVTLDRPANEAGAQVIPSKVAGYAVFRQRVSGRPDYEAAVPISSRFDVRFTIPFDNRAGFSTGVALVNSDFQSGASVAMTARAGDGTVIRSDTFTIPAGGKLVFSVPTRYAELAGRLGVLQFSTSGRMFSGLGLRFNATGPFTATPALSLP
jgi:hypothetical protein